MADGDGDPAAGTDGAELHAAEPDDLASLLATTAAKHPERTAIVGESTRLTYAEFDRAASRTAAQLAGRGVRAGDPVALLCRNVPEFPLLYYGILRAGGVVVPLDVLLDERSLSHRLRDSRAVLLICVPSADDLPTAAVAADAAARVETCRGVLVVDQDVSASGIVSNGVQGDGLSDTAADPVAESVAGGATVPAGPAEARHGSDVAVVVYPTRTRGQPKGVALTHAGLRHNARVVAECLFEPRRDDVHLVVLPLFHLVAQTMQLNAGVATGATLLLVPRFDPASALRLMATHGVTSLVAVPTMLWALTEAADDHPAEAAALRRTLRLVCSELAALPDDVRRGFADRYGVEVLEGYGLSETGPVALHSCPGTARPGTVGRPLRGVEVRLVAPDGSAVRDGDQGEIEVRGPSLMAGYLGRPQDTQAALHDGWFRTGDAARRDADGFYVMDDRPKRMILRGGLAVYPRAVEEALLTHPAVGTATVVGVPHERHGEEVRTVLVRRPGAVVSQAELVAWSRQQLPGFTGEVEVRDADPAPSGAVGRRSRLRRLLPGVGVALAGTLLAFLANRFVPVLSPLTAGVLLGVLLTNTVGLPEIARPGLTVATKRLLRAGVVLLGLQLSLPALAGLGVPLLAVVVLTVVVGFVGTRWIGAVLGLPRDLVLITATGFSICGASAIAAMESATDADEDEVATAIALVTIFGSVALLLWPLLQQPLGLPGEAYGAWTGASVHEVAQVVAAASPAGAAALGTAVVVKLSRVVLLAPLVAAVTVAARRRGVRSADGKRPPLVPLFVLGFLAMVAARSTGLLPDVVLEVSATLTTALLAAALFGLGTGVRVRVLLATGPRAVVLGAASTVLVAAVAYLGVLLAVPHPPV